MQTEGVPEERFQSKVEISTLVASDLDHVAAASDAGVEVSTIQVAKSLKRAFEERPYEKQGLVTPMGGS